MGADPLTGEFKVSLSPRNVLRDAQLVELPCGRCIGCRLARARDWATRCVHESRMHSENAFLTLTYATAPQSVSVRDLQLFFKRLRHYSKREFRYFAVGEYGEKLSRPHYHVLLFGMDFPDKYFWKQSGEHRLYRSPLLEQAWTQGHSTTGGVTSESAMYVAAYGIKQVRGKRAVKHYAGRQREFCVMSRRPGLGRAWLDRYASDVFPVDFVVLPGGRRCGVPRYYSDRQEPELREALKSRRLERNRPADPWEAMARRPAIAKFMELREKHFNERRVADEVSSLRGS